MPTSNKPLRIVADRNIPLVEKAFAPFGEVAALPTTSITPESARRADALIVRSETKVTAALLDGSPVTFVGSASIGTDHVDLDELADRGIAFANAPGCNSDSVKEYIFAALLHLAGERSFLLRGKTLGIVGVGSVGRKVAAAAAGLGMAVLLNDPPRARDEGAAGFLPLDDLMAADIVTLHVPLTRSGEDATYQLFDAGRLARMKPGAVLINASRGAVVPTSALKRALAGGHLAAAILDVWDNEPDVDLELLSRTALGTAHIAGYSMEGKLNAVRLVREAFCRHFGLDAPSGDEPSARHSPVDVGQGQVRREWVPGQSPGPLPTRPLKTAWSTRPLKTAWSSQTSQTSQTPQTPWDPFQEIPAPEITDIRVAPDPLPPEDILRKVVTACYDIRVDDELLRRAAALPAEKRPDYFRGLRAEYRVRREFSNVTVHLPRAHEGLGKSLAALGFRFKIQ